MGEPGLNQKVYTWAHSHVGNRVGRGECWDLPDLALKSAGASSSTTTGDHDDYVWGDAIGVHEVSAGDILQFRDHLIVITKVTTVTFSDGTGYAETNTEEHRRPHHSAIVASYEPGVVAVIEQIPGKRVLRNKVFLNSGALGTQSSMKMVKDDSGKQRQATVNVRTSVKVTGKVWAYRPKTKTKGAGAK